MPSSSIVKGVLGRGPRQVNEGEGREIEVSLPLSGEIQQARQDVYEDAMEPQMVTEFGVIRKVPSPLNPVEERSIFVVLRSRQCFAVRNPFGVKCRASILRQGQVCSQGLDLVKLVACDRILSEIGGEQVVVSKSKELA
jgi:hypothetical protein